MTNCRDPAVIPPPIYIPPPYPAGPHQASAILLHKGAQRSYQHTEDSYSLVGRCLLAIQPPKALAGFGLLLSQFQGPAVPNLPFAES